MGFSSKEQSDGSSPRALPHHGAYRIYRNDHPCTSTVEFYVSQARHEALFCSVCVAIFQVEKNCFHAKTQFGTRKITKNAATMADTNNTTAIVAVAPASCTVPRASFFALPPTT